MCSSVYICAPRRAIGLEQWFADENTKEEIPG
jgi:hypothetical protein